MPHRKLEKLLQGAFKSEESQYLFRHNVFKRELTIVSNTTESYEYLVEIGTLLLRQRRELAAMMEHNEQDKNSPGKRNEKRSSN